MQKTVVELFAGVGGFRVGLNEVKLKNNKVFQENTWDFVWANQWEPSVKSQHAYNCYIQRFGAEKTSPALEKCKCTIQVLHFQAGLFHLTLRNITTLAAVTADNIFFRRIQLIHSFS